MVTEFITWQDFLNIFMNVEWEDDTRVVAHYNPFCWELYPNRHGHDHELQLRSILSGELFTIYWEHRGGGHR